MIIGSLGFFFKGHVGSDFDPPGSAFTSEPNPPGSSSSPPCTFAKKIMLRTMAVNLPVHFVPNFLRPLFMGCIHVPGTDRKLYISAIDYIVIGESRTDPSYTPFLPFTTFPPPNHAVLNSHHYIRSTHNSPKYPQIRQYSSMEIELHPVVSLLE